VPVASVGGSSRWRPGGPGGEYSAARDELEILVADDVPDVRQVIADTLRMEGHRVTTASNGDSAIRLLREHHFDLVFTDLNMPPGTSGFALIAALREVDAEVPIVVISCTFVDRVNNEIAQSGTVLGTLRKPFQLLDLLDLVEQVRLRRLGAD